MMDVEPGRRLFTRDGRKIGNAIVVGLIKHSLSNVGEVWEIETDFGNRCKFTLTEIDSYYHPYDPEMEILRPGYDTWINDRDELRAQNKMDDAVEKHDLTGG